MIYESPNKNYETFDMFKTNLLIILTSVAIVFSFGLAIKGMYTSSKFLTMLLFTSGIISIFNLIYLKKTNNYNVVGNVSIYTFYILMFYLVYTGGVNGDTGPLWIYFLAPFTFYMQGLRKGIYNIAGFLFILFIILYILEPNAIKAEYHSAYKLRILLAFLLTTFVSAAYEYSRSISYSRVCALQEKVEKISLYDDLTGTHNRRGYRKHINNINSSNGSILMCDIDNFKNINDTYGHLAGDYSIKEVAKCIKNNLRHEDLVVRWGGDEFFVFLQGVSIDKAENIALKIQESIKGIALDYDEDVNLSVSIGLAKIDTESSLEESIREADNNMYKYKYTKKLVP